MTAIALAPEPTTTGQPRRLNPPTSPSFEIRGAVGVSVSGPRWDRINSADVIACARRIYHDYVASGSVCAEPIGIVIAATPSGQSASLGRAVFEPPVLLPGEQYLPLELVRPRTGRGRNPRPFTRG